MIFTAEEKKRIDAMHAEWEEQACLHHALVHLLTDCEGDKQFYKRLLWAQKYINDMLSEFTEEEKDEYEERYDEV
jgi:hypothetical protein